MSYADDIMHEVDEAMRGFHDSQYWESEPVDQPSDERPYYQRIEDACKKADAEIGCLTAENERLREALQSILDDDDAPSYSNFGGVRYTARAALSYKEPAK